MHTVKIISINKLAHDVLEIRTEKPSVFKFIPGHSIMLSINKPELTQLKRPYNFTSANSDSHLEFIIKIYKERKSLSGQFEKLNVGDSLILSEMFGSHRYIEQGVFIAGGVGVTPFVSIFRQLNKDNALKNNILLYSNKTSKDIILKDELKSLLGNNCLFVLTRESNSQGQTGRINKSFLLKYIKDFNQRYYICGPDSFTRDIKQMIDEIKREKA